MATKVGSVHVKRVRGKLIVYGMSQTPRGQRFIKKIVPLKATKIRSPEFKSELTAAVEELMA